MTLDQPRTHNVDNEITTLDGDSTLVDYDHAGNMMTVPQPADWSSVYTLKWDAWNRLVEVKKGSVGVASYAYDGLTRRTQQSAADVNRHYYYSDQWKVVEEQLGTATTPERQFVWRGCNEDKLILRDTPLAAVSRLYALDDGKNVTAACDASGSVQERYGYRGFGTPVFMDATFGSRTASGYTWETLYCGYRYDSDSELYQVRYRYLHFQIGRWLSRDPLGEQRRINLFCYIRNRAANFCDPYGLYESSPLWQLPEFPPSPVGPGPGLSLAPPVESAPLLPSDGGGSPILAPPYGPQDPYPFPGFSPPPQFPGGPSTIPGPPGPPGGPTKPPYDPVKEVEKEMEDCKSCKSVAACLACCEGHALLLEAYILAADEALSASCLLAVYPLAIAACELTALGIAAAEGTKLTFEIASCLDNCTKI